MVLFNYSTKELTAKIVYYGPGLCGKTTNLQFIHGNLPGNVKGKMLSLATKTDRTLFFDFLPIDLGEIRGMKTRVQLYTVPGQVFYNETRKLVLKGADGIVFVADSQQQMLGANAESFKNLEDNLKGHAMSLADMPHVIQFNKRDLPKLAGIEEMNAAINKYNAPFYESVATTGIGVQDTLKAITKLVLLNLTKKYDPQSAAAMVAETPAAAAPPAAPAPAALPVQPAPAEVPAAPIAAVPETPAAPIGPTPTAGIPLSDVAPAAETPAFDAAEELPLHEISPEPVPGPVVATEPAGGPGFQVDEIDELVGEVAEVDDSGGAPAIDQPPVELGVEDPTRFEIDASGLDFEEPTDAGPPPLGETAEPPAPVVAAEGAQPSESEPSLNIDPEVDFGLPEEAAAGAGTAELHADPAYEPAEALPAEPAPPAVALENRDDPVRLSEVAGDADLFDDPTVEVARLAGGGEQEIVIPVELADGERGLFRYRLSVKLRLDPIDS